MLVLSRRAGESVVVGDDVVVTVLDVRGDVVRIGITAPRAIQVHREEVYRELQQANREAALPGHLADAALGALLSPDPGRSGPAARPAPGASRPPTPGPSGS
jgi:carbon storage regulator